MNQGRYFTHCLYVSRSGFLLCLGVGLLTSQPAIADDSFGWRFAYHHEANVANATAVDASGHTHAAGAIQNGPFIDGFVDGSAVTYSNFHLWGIDTTYAEPLHDDGSGFSWASLDTVAVANALPNESTAQANVSDAPYLTYSTFAVSINAVYTDFTTDSPANPYTIPSTGLTVGKTLVYTGVADAVASYTTQNSAWASNIGTAQSSLYLNWMLSDSILEAIPGDVNQGLPVSYLAAASPTPNTFGSTWTPVLYDQPEFIHQINGTNYYNEHSISGIVNRFRGGGGIVQNSSLVWGFNLDLVSGMYVEDISVPQSYFQAAGTSGEGSAAAELDYNVGASATNGSGAIVDNFAVIFVKGGSY